MYYEIYIDQFFAEQFLIGVILLAVTGILCHAVVSWKRLAAGALLSAVCMTAFVCLRMPMLFPMSLPAAAAAALWKRPLKKEWRHNRNGTLMLLAVTVCFGGAAEALCSLLPLSVTAVSALAAIAAYGLTRSLGRQIQKGGRAAEITIRKGERSLVLHGFVDTGNQLTEPVTGRPVSIAEETVLEELLGEGWEERQGFCLIPYHTLGESDGWMRAVVFDEMRVVTRLGSKSFQRPLLALYEGELSKKETCQMILHPEHAPP
ncbi:MAG: sigma-E processing peptidase SpoIIGA [Lachnospiraceae bacterium]|nr:sigma-E processing peptidase SpoIIGA [Lachnospiraceae bacterium]